MHKLWNLSVVTLMIAVVAGLALGLGGCTTSSTVDASPVRTELGKVAIVPFENLSSEPNAGLIVMKNMDSAFRKYTSLDIIDTNLMRQRLETFEGQYLAPVKIGEMLGVDSVITGSVTEYRYVYGAGEQPVVALTMQIISVKTGETLWSEQVSSTGNFSWIRESSLAEVAAQISMSLARNFKRVYSPLAAE